MACEYHLFKAGEILYVLHNPELRLLTDELWSVALSTVTMLVMSLLGNSLGIAPGSPGRYPHVSINIYFSILFCCCCCCSCWTSLPAQETLLSCSEVERVPVKLYLSERVRMLLQLKVEETCQKMYSSESQNRCRLTQTGRMTDEFFQFFLLLRVFVALQKCLLSWRCLQRIH